MAYHRSINAAMKGILTPSNVENGRAYQSYPAAGNQWSAADCGWGGAYIYHYGGCCEDVTAVNQLNSSFRQRTNDGWFYDDTGNSIDGYFAQTPQGGAYGGGDPNNNVNTSGQYYMRWFHHPYGSSGQTVPNNWIEYYQGFDAGGVNSDDLYGVHAGPLSSQIWYKIISVGGLADYYYDIWVNTPAEN